MTIRSTLVLIHRYVGLVMAGFLIIAGLTGSLLVWYDELDAWINQDMMRVEPPIPGANPIPPIDLRHRIAEKFPQSMFNYTRLYFSDVNEAAVFYPRTVSGSDMKLDFDQVFVNPYTGDILGSRTRGDITEGVTNLMPFIYRLHYALALGTIGTYTFGIIALLWTLDCFVGAYLTFPRRKRNKKRYSNSNSWLQRWWPAWKVRWSGGSYKVNFDLHVAGGLWPWVLLFILAWSSVAFNLYGEVYRPVTSAVFEMQERPYDLPNVAEPSEQPSLGWQQGYALAQQRMADLAETKGFEVIRDDRLYYSPEKNFFRYVVKTDRDVGEQYGTTAVFIDATSGELVASFIPSGEAVGDTITQWLYYLHMAQVWGFPFRVLMTVVGLAVAILSVTGVVIWWRKRQARRANVHRKQSVASKQNSDIRVPASNSFRERT